MQPSELHRLISLTFDSNPTVRRQAATELGTVDDPGAVFALIELSYDKNTDVAQTARSILQSKKSNEPKKLSFAELFRTGKETEDEKKQTKEEQLEQILQKSLGKERAKKLKDKISPKVLDLDMEETKEQDESKRIAMQQFLTAYLEELGVLGLNQEKLDSLSPSDGSKKQDPQLEQTLKETVGSGIGHDAFLIGEDAEEVENERHFTLEYEGEKIPFNTTMKSIFQIALETLMATDKEKSMKDQIKQLKKTLSYQVDLAFKIAKEKISKKHVVNISEIRDGMRRIYTEPLLVEKVEVNEYMRTKTKKDLYTRLIVKDNEGNEGIIYLFKSRGTKIQKGTYVKLENARAKYFKFSGETALTVSNSGKVVCEF